MANSERQARFEQLLTVEVYRAAWRYALRLCATREDAEDLLQDALIQALTKLDSLRDTTRFKGWLLSILRHRFLGRLRRDKARPQSTELPLQLAGVELDPLAGEIAAALASLPKPQQELLGLYYIDGLSLNEVGQVLKLSTAAARQRMFRARQALRKLITAPCAAQGSSAPKLRVAGGECHD